MLVFIESVVKHSYKQKDTCVFPFFVFRIDLATKDDQEFNNMKVPYFFSNGGRPRVRFFVL